MHNNLENVKKKKKKLTL